MHGYILLKLSLGTYMCPTRWWVYFSLVAKIITVLPIFHLEAGIDAEKWVWAAFTWSCLRLLPESLNHFFFPAVLMHSLPHSSPSSIISFKASTLPIWESVWCSEVSKSTMRSEITWNLKNSPGSFVGSHLSAGSLNVWVMLLREVYSGQQHWPGDACLTVDLAGGQVKGMEAKA